MVSRVHCQGRPGVSKCCVPLVGVEDGAEERPAPDQEAEIGCDPGERDQGHSSAWPAARTKQDAEREYESEQNARCSDRVRPLRVEVGLVDDAGPENRPAQEARRHAEQRDRATARLCGHHGQDRDCRQGQRPVEEDDDTTGASRSAVLTYVVQLVHRRPGVRGEDLGSDQEEQAPEHGDFAETRVRGVASAGHGR